MSVNSFAGFKSVGKKMKSTTRWNVNYWFNVPPVPFCSLLHWDSNLDTRT